MRRAHLRRVIILSLRRMRSERLSDLTNAVAKRMHPHFLKEEEYALPQLGLLRDLAEDKVPPDKKCDTGIYFASLMNEKRVHSIPEAGR